MKTFHIQKPDEAIKEALIDKINNLTKRSFRLGQIIDFVNQSFFDGFIWLLNMKCFHVYFIFTGIPLAMRYTSLACDAMY